MYYQDNQGGEGGEQWNQGEGGEQWGQGQEGDQWGQGQEGWGGDPNQQVHCCRIISKKNSKGYILLIHIY